MPRPRAGEPAGLRPASRPGGPWWPETRQRVSRAALRSSRAAIGRQAGVAPGRTRLPLDSPVLAAAGTPVERRCPTRDGFLRRVAGTTAAPPVPFPWLPAGRPCATRPRNPPKPGRRPALLEFFPVTRAVDRPRVRRWGRPLDRRRWPRQCPPGVPTPARTPLGPVHHQERWTDRLGTHPLPGTVRPSRTGHAPAPVHRSAR